MTTRSVRDTPIELREVVLKSAVVHSLTYLVVGLVAATALDYAGLFATSGLGEYMRPTTDRWVMAGPLFQPLRGAMFGVVVYLLRGPVLEAPRGWLTLWFVLVALGIAGTFGPSPGSFEGMIYTVLPLWVHLRGLPEVLVQSLLYAVLLHTWVTAPRRWLTWTLSVTCALLLALPALGLVVTALGIAPAP